MAQDASEGLWQSLLREVSIRSCKFSSAMSKTHSFSCLCVGHKQRVPDSTLIVGGANKCGKRTLLAHLQTSGAADNSNSASQTDSYK
jgi:hypothetical protein